MEKQAPATTINKEERSAVPQDPRTYEQKKEFLRASIDHPGFKIDIQSENAMQALTEIRRIVESLGATDIIEPEDFTAFELSALLSEEFIGDKNAMKEIKKLLSMEQQYRVVKALLPAMEEIDLIAGKKLLHLENKTIKEGVAQLTREIDVSATRHALIHIKGLVEEQERMIIADRVHEQMPHASIRAYQTEQDIEGKILVEAMFFGDYDEVD